MGLITQHFATGFRCDKSGCDNRIEGEQMGIHAAEQHYRDLAIQAGWSFTYRRRLWAHCPEHRRDY